MLALRESSCTEECQARGDSEEELEKKKGLLRQLLEEDDGALEDVLFEKVKKAVKALKRQK